MIVVACSRRSDSRARPSDGGERVKLYTSIFFRHEFFFRALLSECLEQAIVVEARKMFKAQFDKIHQILWLYSVRIITFFQTEFFFFHFFWNSFNWFQSMSGKQSLFHFPAEGANLDKGP